MIALVLSLALSQAGTPPAATVPAPQATPALPVPASEDEQEFFQLFDADKDGTITRAEFDAFAANADREAAAADPAQKGKVTEGLGVVFPMFDRNGDARITRDEFRALAKAGQ